MMLPETVPIEAKRLKFWRPSSSLVEAFDAQAYQIPSAVKPPSAILLLSKPLSNCENNISARRIHIVKFSRNINIQFQAVTVIYGCHTY